MLSPYEIPITSDYLNQSRECASCGLPIKEGDIPLEISFGELKRVKSGRLYVDAHPDFLHPTKDCITYFFNNILADLEVCLDDSPEEPRYCSICDAKLDGDID